MAEHATDRRHLITTAYASSANLCARQSIYRFQNPQFQFVDWELAHVEWKGVEAVIDVGCGNGAYLQRLAGRVPRLLGLDLSHGMLTQLAADWQALVPPHLADADIQALPLPDESADVSLAMHMLYHVPDIGAAVRELRRVLRPGGVLLAATNGAPHVREVFELLAQTAGVDGGDTSTFRRSFLRFAAENGSAYLGSAFDRVEWRAVASTLVVPEVRPVLDYLGSMRGWVEDVLPGGVTWEGCMAEAERIVSRRIAAEGAFRVTAHAGTFVCR